jgi:hypothetical protein
MIKPGSIAFLQEQGSAIFRVHRNEHFSRVKGSGDVLGCHQMGIGMSGIKLYANEECSCRRNLRSARAVKRSLRT